MNLKNFKRPSNTSYEPSLERNGISIAQNKKTLNSKKLENAVPKLHQQDSKSTTRPNRFKRNISNPLALDVSVDSEKNSSSHRNVVLQFSSEGQSGITPVSL